ncbi:MAG: FtsX-like permease family protein [Phycisphaerales bacterium]|nr:MAG: FtsX-like permease family protein [Phycisphaerales bacterium]
MRVLTRKLWREIFNSAGVLATVVVIIMVGTSSFICVKSAQRILETSQEAYYRDYRFADFWVNVKKAPLSAVKRVADLPGVAAVESRVVFDVILDLPHVVEPITGRLISAPTRGFDETINGISLVRGSGFSDDRNEEVILGEGFAQEHDLHPGDRINLILNRKRESFIIAGTALSPEYVYMVRGEGDFTPDAEHFGILYVKEAYARKALDFDGACNEIVGRLVPGAQADVDLLLDRIDRMLQPFGVLSTTPRSRQASHRFLSDEIRGLGITATVMPTIFLAVAALVLNILMTRLAERQRTTMGTLKALGYSNRQVITHFLGFGVVVGIVGGLTGIGLGISMSYGLISLYADFFKFPQFLFTTYADLWIVGMIISVVFSVAGTIKGTLAVLRLTPAEAMRPKPPARGGAVFLEKYPALWRSMGFRSHIALRSLLRNPTRTLSGILSTALAGSIILSTLMMYDSMWYLVDFQFEHVLRSDATIGMRDERSRLALYETQRLPGVDYAEPTLGVVCDIRNGRNARRLAVLALEENHRLTNPCQRDLSPIAIPPQGLVLASKLANILDADVGDRLELTPVRGRRRTVQVPVASIVEGFLGLDCYADLTYLSRMVGEAAAVNSVQLSVNPVRADALFRTVKTLPNAQGFSVRANTKGNIESTFIETMGISLGMMVIFAGVIAFGSMINLSLIEITDRQRDIATFRVLGYHPSQVAAIFFRQNMIVFTLGLILSFPLGYGMVVGMAQAYDTELFRMPVVVNLPVIVWTGLLAFGFVLLAQWVVYRQIAKLDWLEAVQAKE